MRLFSPSTRRTSRALTLLVFPWLFALAAEPAASESGELFREYDLKAAFLYNLPQFVEWPRDALAESSLTLCVVGRDPFGDALDYFAGRSVQGRQLAVRRVPVEGSTEDCPMVFVGSADRIETRQILRRLKGRAVLTVGETGDFTRLGGVIRLVVAGERVGLEVNLAAAEAAGLSLSAKLLHLATVVRYSETVEEPDP